MADRYDIVIVGGGIHGVGVAQAAAAHGHSVLVLEKNDLASGTSSRSSKLIHGGLRYLETGQFSLVRRCLQERAILLRVAPHLVRMRNFYFPVYRGTRRRPWTMRAGLSLYSILSGLGPSTRFGSIPRTEWGRLDGLITEDLLAVFRYADAQTDDAMLTRAVMRSAEQLGAELAVGTQFIGCQTHGHGCSIEFSSNGNVHHCGARVLVNAAGPWVNQVLSRIDCGMPGCAIEMVQGAHIVMAGSVERGIYYLEAPLDGRGVFVMPWQGKALVGTTETSYHNDPDDVAPLESELKYLANVVGHFFPNLAAVKEPADQTAFAGLRVLPSGNGSAHSRSRQVLLHTDHVDRPRVLTIYGGKLTAYRHTAERVLDRLRKVLPRRKILADTRRLVLPV